MSHSRPQRSLASALSGPWMIRPDAVGPLRQALEPGAIFRPEPDDDDDGDGGWRPHRPANRPETIEGVAVIPVYGPIFRHENYLDVAIAWYRGGTCLSYLADAFRAALGDDQVRAILFAFDTPGGEATGIADFAREIREGAKIKPVGAFAEGSCCSAGYYLAAAAGEISASPNAMVGSIGVVFPLIDDSKAMEMLGLEDVSVISRQSPHKWADPATEDGRRFWQETADDLGARFVADVAEYRGTTPQAVLADFGQGWVKVGEHARKAGMVDRVGTFEDALAKLSGPGRARLAKARPSAESAPVRATLSLNPETRNVRLVLPR